MSFCELTPLTLWAAFERLMPEWRTGAGHLSAWGRGAGYTLAHYIGR